MVLKLARHLGVTCLAVLVFAPAIRAQDVVVSYTTTNTTPLNPGFAGFCTEMLADTVEYTDTNFQQFVSALSPGWLRYPGGELSDAFDWQTGLSVQSWIDEFSNYPTVSNLLQDTVIALGGKGGDQFSDFASMAANVGDAKIVVDVNGFTDSAASYGVMAQYALSNNIAVAAWELSNEAYIFQGANSSFWTNANEYADKMKPYRDAIKAVDSNAVVAVFFNDAAAATNNIWDRDLRNYTNKYWDAVVYHHYPVLPTNSVSFADLMALDNGVLISDTTAYVTSHLMPDNNSNTTYLITEFNPAKGDGNGGQYPPTATLYGGIYAAEYVMRLSTLPQMLFVGSYQLLNASGIDDTNDFLSIVKAAYNAGQTTNTTSFKYGFYLTAQVSGEAVAFGALTHATDLYETTTSGGATVPVTTNGTATIPAVYAQAYQGNNGLRYVVLTNKGSTPQTVQIVEDSVPLTNQFLETYVTGSDPSSVNTNPPPNPIQIQTTNVQNIVTVPMYSVVRLEWPISAGGSLQVTISPQGAIDAGAQWQVDSGPLQASEATVSGLSNGNHSVHFTTISDWTAPNNQVVDISTGATTMITGTYTQQTGSLQVTVDPLGAADAGAQWQVDGGILQTNGATVSSLAVGSHTLQFTTITGWTTPGNQQVTISNGLTTMATGTYAQIDITPPTLAVLSPTDYQTFTNAAITVTGTATDASGVKSVTVNGAAATLNGTNWSEGVTLAFGTNTVTVIATDNSPNQNTATQVVYAVGVPASTNLPPVIVSPPVATNALLQIGDEFVVVAGETVTFNVGATDPQGFALTYGWTFGDGVTNEASPQSSAAHAYSATNCGPFTASVTVSDGFASTTSNVNVAVACELTVTKLQLTLSFAKTNDDSASLTSTLVPPDGFSPTNAQVTVDIGGAIGTFSLNDKGDGKGADESCKLVYSKSKGWTLTATMKKGSWHDQWAGYGLVPGPVAKSGVPVTVPVVVLLGTDAVAAQRQMQYTANTAKNGSAH